MTTAWLRDNALTLAVVVAGIGTVSGWTQAAKHRGIAEANAEQAGRLTATITMLEDSVTVANARSAQASAEADEVRRAYEDRMDSLTARLRGLRTLNRDLEAAAEAELAEHDGWLSRELHEAVVAGLERTIIATDSARVEAEALARAERQRGDALSVEIGALMAQVGVLEQRDSVRVREIEALRAADRGILPDFGAITKPVYVAIGAALGYLAAEVRNDGRR